MDKESMIQAAKKQWPLLMDADVLHDMWLRKFQADPALQDEFENNYPAYFFFCLAEQTGSFKIQGARK